VRRVQKEFLDRHDLEKYERLIVFFVAGYDVAAGGVLSVISIATETEKLLSDKRTGVFVCGVPGDPPLARFTHFDNNHTVVDCFDLLERCPKVRTILFHIPECYTQRLLDRAPQLFAILGERQVHFNILLQNIDRAPHVHLVEKLKSFGCVTITTAHKAYSGIETQQRYACPVHHLSVWVSKEGYTFKEFEKKKNLIVVSPDNDHPSLRRAVLDKIRRELTEFELVVIKGMTYTQYKQVISEAKFSMTFGEGLDGYFAEPVFSGGIGCAVYNERFFNAEYR